MKHLLAGCGLIFILALALTAWMGWRVYTGLKPGMERLEQLGEQVEQLDRDFPFNPGRGRLVEGGQLDRWLAIRHELAGGAIPPQGGTEWTSVSFFELPRVIDRRAIEPTSTTVAALRRYRMSAREFIWIRGQLYGTLSSRQIRRHKGLTDLRAAFGRYRERTRRTAARGEGGPEPLPLVPGDQPLSHAQIRRMIELIAERRKDIRGILEGSRALPLVFFHRRGVMRPGERPGPSPAPD